LLPLYCPSLEELFVRGGEMDWFESSDECCRKIQYYLDHDEQRRKIADAGYRLAHEKYSYEKMAAKIVNDISRELQAPAL
jgi:spore maturation protein CgeB